MFRALAGGLARCERFVAAALVLALVASTVPAVAQQSMTWTAGAVGGGWYAISGGMAELLREKAGLNIKVIPERRHRRTRCWSRRARPSSAWGCRRSSAPRCEERTRTRDKKDPNLRALAGNMSLNTFHFYVAADSPYAEDVDGGDRQGQEAHPGRHLQARILKRLGLREGDGVLRPLRSPGKIDDCYKSLGGCGRQVLPRLVQRTGGRLQGPERGRDLHLPRAAWRVHH